MKIIYEKHNGNIVTIIPNEMDYKLIFSKSGEDYISNLDEIILEELPVDYTKTYKYYIKNNQILKYTDSELEENEIYGRVLTEEERQLERIKPSREEVRKAEETIEILNLLSEVL